jgi:hypothetical protein
MPVINIKISEDDYKKLQAEHKKMASAAFMSERHAAPPSFEEWLATRAASGICAEAAETGLNELRIFNAIEKLITSLGSHDFGLAHLSRVNSGKSARELAESIVRELDLSQQQSKRIHELLAYYAKSAREIADLAKVGVTHRVDRTLHEAYAELLDRTEKARARLGEDRALGRVEGASAMLVNLHVMDRQTAEEKVERFKLQARNPK